ncbi:MAG TPA: DUF3015 family protein [Polyangiales bacterium]
MRKHITMTIAMGLLGVATLAAVGTAKAEEGYGMAGCGLGSLLFGTKPGIIQVLAATTNGTSASQTFGITTGTSNCKDTKAGTASAKAFIQANREAVSKDIARGQGETITNLAALAGCGSDKAVGAALQRDFKAIFPSEKVSDVAVSDSVVNMLRSHSELACRDLS